MKPIKTYIRLLCASWFVLRGMLSSQKHVERHTIRRVERHTIRQQA